MALVVHKYMPAQMPTEELRATFAARQHTLDYLVRAFREQTGSRTPTSYLMTGPRGAGKTTLVLMLCLRIEQDPDLRAAWLPVRFPEELPAVTSLRDLLAAALHLLADDGVPGAREWLIQVEAEGEEERSQNLAIAGLRAVAQSDKRRLVLFVENLDTVFERGLDRGSQATLRRLLMNDPFMLVVGTAVHVFEELRTYDSAFFNYFCPVPLERLDDDQVYELLSRRAQHDGNAEFEERYRRERPKVRALSQLAGGNPRLVLMLYEILGQRSIGPVVETLRQLVDELTPLLKDVVEHQLAGQQIKILDALMRAGGTATPADLSRATRLPLNTVTTQLSRLRGAQVVEVRGGGKGRAAYYTVADPLFSVWYQMRYLRPQRRKIEMFVEILRIWFETKERFDVLRGFTPEGITAKAAREMAIAAEYYAASLSDSPYSSAAEEIAVKNWLAVGDVREAALALAELHAQRARQASASDTGAYRHLGRWLQDRGEVKQSVDALRAALKREPGHIGLRLEYGLALGLAGECEAAFRVFDEVVQETQDPVVRAQALLNRGVSRSFLEDHESAIADYTAVAELVGAPAEVIASALGNLGTRLSALGRSEDAIHVYDDLLVRFRDRNEPALVKALAEALVNKGVALDTVGRAEDAIRVYDDILARFGNQSDVALAEQVGRALINKGATLAALGRSDDAIRVYDSVLLRFGHRSEPELAAQVGRALVNKGVRLGALGRSEDAIRVCDDVLARFGDGGAPALDEAVARALVNKGIALGDLGRPADTIRVSDEILDRFGDQSAAALAEQVAEALINKGVALGALGRAEDAIRVYDDILDRFGNRSDVLGAQLVAALVNRAVALSTLGRSEDAIRDYDDVLARFGGRSESIFAERVAAALVNKGIALGALGRSEDAIRVFDNVLARLGDRSDSASAEQVARALGNKGVALGVLDRSEEAVRVFDYIVARFGDRREAMLADQVAGALFNKGVALRALGRFEDAIHVYDDVLVRFGDRSEPALAEQVARALVNKGVVLGALGRSEEAITVYDDMLARLGDRGAPALVELAARALINKGLRLDALGRPQDAIRLYDNALARFGDRRDPALTEEVARALVNKVSALRALDRSGDAIGVCDDILARFGHQSSAALAERVAEALLNRAAILDDLSRSDDAIRAYDDVIARFGDRSESALAERVAQALVGRAAVRLQAGDAAAAIDDNSAVLTIVGISAAIRAAARFNRAAARKRRGEPDQALTDWVSLIADGQMPSAMRLESARAALKTFWRDSASLDRITTALQPGLAVLDLAQRVEQLVRLLGSLASPDMRDGWSTIWRAILRTLSSDTASQLTVFTAIGETLERRADLSPLDPLPPEQREFALEVIRRFGAPTPG